MEVRYIYTCLHRATVAVVQATDDAEAGAAIAIYGTFGNYTGIQCHISNDQATKLFIGVTAISFLTWGDQTSIDLMQASV